MERESVKLKDKEGNLITVEHAFRVAKEDKLPPLDKGEVVDINTLDNLEIPEDKFKDKAEFKATEALAVADPILIRVDKLIVKNREIISSSRSKTTKSYAFSKDKLASFELPKNKGLSRSDGKRILIYITSILEKSRPIYTI